ncbi:heme biosynthesis HemY N-terminal domain-containing protein [Nitrosomonas aestuarii]|uniref:heme biosynthesis HemY N-terminal domain-containing protein n=1 Tax=Nitrosomonas aestuarii TaxID=52441 RepID=UPI000D317B11|nr:heme biosynthesis HemY N-terminal domain-containing protein [Nitrosomonas aestuarii]PTN09140.1 HemY protein [Nitrosomonas aestuarii]
MRLILWVLVLFAAAVAVALAVEEYSTGHLIVEIPSFEKIELSLDYAVAGLVAAFVVFYILVRMLIGLFDRRNIRAESLMLTGLKAFFEGDYDKAKKSATKGFKLAKTPLIKTINSVVATRSAHYVADTFTRDALLAKTEQEVQDERALRLVTKAELLLSAGRPQEALEALQDLYSTGGLQPTAVLRLELEAQKQVKNWDAVLEIADVLRRRHPLSRDNFEKIRHEAHLQNFKIKATNLKSLSKYWHSLSEHEQGNSRLAAAATRAYISLGDCATAHKIVERNVQTDWDSELILLYAECLNYHVSRQIECAEVWLKAQPNNADLLLMLGKLCAHCELWGKAQSYLEASVSVEPSATAHFSLAQLNEKLGKHELAMDHYNKALELTLRTSLAV